MSRVMSAATINLSVSRGRFCLTHLRVSRRTVPLTHCCNLFLSRKRLFDRYCEWLFPLVQRIEKEAEEKEAEDPRYIGYIVEMILFNTYIRKYRLNVMHRNACVLGRKGFLGKAVRSGIYGSPAASWIKCRIPKKIRKIFTHMENEEIC